MAQSEDLGLKKITDAVVSDCLKLKRKERLFVIVKMEGNEKNFHEGMKIGSNFLKSAIDSGSEANLFFCKTVDDPNREEDKVFNMIEASWGMHASFKNFRCLARKLNAGFYSPPEVLVIVSGGGYTGKDIVGRSVGYPIPGSNDKWNSGLSVLNKFKWKIQSKLDRRNPMSRTALTYAMPLKKFAKCMGVNYIALARKTKKLAEIVKDSEKVYVRSKPVYIQGKKLANDISFEVKREWVEMDDGMCRRPGDYVNLPTGEVFLTPYSADGTFIADGSIHLDSSYLIRKPFAIIVEKGRYRDFVADEKMLGLIENHLRKSREMLKQLKKSRTVSKETLKIYEENFDRIGELGIGTNSQAELSEFLIEAEKISGTVHMALGAGYTKERDSVHHEDAVAGARIKIDVFADRKQIIRNSRLVV